MNCEELQSLHESAMNSGEPNIERESALFLMHVSNQLSFGHSGVDTLYSCTQSFVESVSSSVSNKVSRVLHQAGITDPAILADIEDACKPEDMFNHLSSRYYREKYYENNLHYVVISNTIIVGYFSG